jgi:hypothetical protein
MYIDEVNGKAWKLDTENKKLSYDKKEKVVQDNYLRKNGEKDDGADQTEFGFWKDGFGILPTSDCIDEKWQETAYDEELGAGIILMFKQYKNMIALLLLFTLLTIPTILTFASVETPPDVGL